MRNFRVEETGCSKKCEGLNVVTYFVQDLEPIWSKYVKGTKTRYLNDPAKSKLISKLSDQYIKYKKTFDVPAKLRSINVCIIKLPNLIFCIIGDEFASKLHYIKIYFDTTMFDRIQKDRAAKFVDQLSAIGGTMGLLTGFSIISGVEILYFAVKIILNYINKCRSDKKTRT